MGMLVKPVFFLSVFIAIAAYGADKYPARRNNSQIQSSPRIKVFFSQSTDRRFAGAEPAHGNSELSELAIEQIDRAEHSLDICYYSFTHIGMAYAIHRAFKRGVRVRFIFESDNITDEIVFLRDMGIPAISDRAGGQSGQGAMHNKFIIVDHRDTTSIADDYLWVGSANASYSAATRNAENMLLIQDYHLCAAYTKEFEEMWGSHTDNPDGQKSRFGTRKKDNTPHVFEVDGTTIEVYFSPSDRTEQKIISTLQNADRSVYFCMLIFTSNGIENTLREKWHFSQEFYLKGVLEKENVNSSGSAFYNMQGRGRNGWERPADVLEDRLADFLHHKYCIIDARYKTSDPVVITGSHNWTHAADSKNDENTLIIHSERIADLYLQEFAQRYHESGGNGPFVQVDKRHKKVEIDDDLGQNYPNPFNAGTVIPVYLQPSGPGRENVFIDIYNINGKRVKRLPVFTHVNKTKLEWDGTDQNSRKVASGVYFAVLTGSRIYRTIKLLYLQ